MSKCVLQARPTRAQVYLALIITVCNGDHDRLIYRMHCARDNFRCVCSTHQGVTVNATACSSTIPYGVGNPMFTATEYALWLHPLQLSSQAGSYSCCNLVTMHHLQGHPACPRVKPWHQLSTCAAFISSNQAAPLCQRAMHGPFSFARKERQNVTSREIIPSYSEFPAGNRGVCLAPVTDTSSPGGRV